MIHKRKLLVHSETEYLLFFPENKFDNVCFVIVDYMLVFKEFNQNKSGAKAFKKYCEQYNIKRNQIESFTIKQRFEQRFFDVHRYDFNFD